jgi:hypothetical protein
MVGFVAFVLLWKQTEILVEMDFAPYETFFAALYESKSGIEEAKWDTCHALVNQYKKKSMDPFR